jgi:hypothetical protein
VIRDAARAFLFLLAFLFIVAEVQQLDEMNEPTPMWSPK